MQNAFSQPQSVVVLGGTSDIALAVVERLARQRTRTVVLVGRDGARLADAVARTTEAGASTVAAVLFDATDLAGTDAVIDRAFAATHGPVDLILLAVGDLGHQLADEDDAAAAGYSAVVNFAWPVAALAAVRRRLVAQGSGRIVVLSSVAGVRVRRNNYLYGGAKAGLDRLCGGLADSLVGTGVTLQLVRPGFVRSKMTAGLTEPPLATDVATVADAIVAGLGSGRAVVTSPPALGALTFVLRHLPAPLWRRVTANR